jgi:integrase
MKSRLRLGLPLHEDERSVAALFAKVAQDYLESLDLKLSTCQSYTAILNSTWLAPLGNILIAEIRPSHIKSELAAKQVSQKTKKNLLGPLRGVFEYAMGEGYILSNPCDSIVIAKHQKPAIERFKPEEKARILAQLEGEALVYFTVAFETGMRPGEILGARWDDYDGDTLHVSRAIVRRRITTTKTSEVRDVVVSDALRAALANHPTRFKGGYIFQNARGDHYRDTDAFNPVWQDALRRARVRYRIPYICRHTRASELLTAGIEPAYAAKQLGHTLEMFFRTYAEWIDEARGNEQRDKIRGIGKVVKSKPGKSPTRQREVG